MLIEAYTQSGKPLGDEDLDLASELESEDVYLVTLPGGDLLVHKV